MNSLMRVNSKKILLQLVSLVWLLAAAFVHAEKSRPNIIIYLSDDHSRDDSGAYGNNVVRTPNLDALAKESLLFTRAFAASPTCSPSRSALMTGLFPMRNGAHPNHGQIKDGIKTWPKYFQEIGYRVVIAGKTDIRPRAAFPFEYVVAKVDPKAPSLHEVLDAKAVDQFLADHARTNTKPLCLLVDDWNPHVVWAENDGYDPAKIKLPPYLADTLETRKAMTRYYTDVALMDKTLGACLASMKKYGFENSLFIYTSDQGAQVPHAKWNVYDAGLNVPFLVRWPRKVKSGKTDAMISLIDVLPTCLEAGGGKAPGEIDGESFLPVVFGKTSKHRDFIFGAHTSDIFFKPNGNELWEFPMRCVRTETHKYILNFNPERTFHTHISDAEGRDGKIYWDTWVEQAKTNPATAELVQNYRHRPAEELYDLRNDPYELHNVAADAKNHKLLLSLRKRTLDWMKQQEESEPEIVKSLSSSAP